jgi:hypothetical protein
MLGVRKERPVGVTVRYERYDGRSFLSSLLGKMHCEEGATKNIISVLPDLGKYLLR